MSYEEVTNIVPGLHDGDFDFIIHVGVGRNGFMTLERRAHAGGYYKKDTHGRTGPLKPHQVYITKMDLDYLANQLHLLGVKVRCYAVKVY